VKRRRGGVLKFQQKPKRPPLSREQFLYWMDFLPKVIKIGTEFEINLPSPERALRHPDVQPCQYSNQRCVTDCANMETCMIERHPTFCLTRGTGKFLGKKFGCPAKSDEDVEACLECSSWLLNCRGLDCAMHTPFCTICPVFERRGRKNVENGDVRQDAETVRQEMKRLLQPSGSLGAFGAHGVLEVKKDNSLQHNGGIEVPTIGRRVHWNSFYNMCKDILEPITERGGYVNERCGQHYHILAGYFGQSRAGKPISELEHPMPEVILANLHQLHRRYEVAMFWLMSAGRSMECLTRWARFRQPIRRYSALQSRMSKVHAELSEQIISMTNQQKGKYASIAYHFCEFDNDGDVVTFHIENRVADSPMSPAVVSAFAMLCYALVMKAVRLSQYGIMEIGDKEYCSKLREVEPHLINGQDRGWDGDRRADTSHLGPHIPWLRDNAREMVQLLKSELTNLGPAYDILMELADRPCSLRLMDGDSWEQIERDLYQRDEPGSNDLVAEDEIREIVDLAGIVDCDNVEMWIEEVAAYLGQPPPIVADVIYQMVESGNYRWSPPIGALITA
jgi:hypothetical protein